MGPQMPAMTRFPEMKEQNFPRGQRMAGKENEANPLPAEATAQFIQQCVG
jgi:hypothetical protein